MAKQKTVFQKITAAVMALLLLCVPLLTVGAMAADKQAQNDCPIISVHGFLASKIYADKDDMNSPQIWPLSGEAVLNMAKARAPQMTVAVRQQNWEELTAILTDLYGEIFFPVYLKDNGDVPDNSGVHFGYPKASDVTKGSELAFQYDWRRDPLTIAADLNDFINYVLACSGAKQVNISCHSLGGVITNTYLSIYGHEKVKGVCFNSTAVYGSSMVGQLMSGDVIFDSEALQKYLYFAFDYNEFHHLINGLINLAKTIGLLDFIAKEGKVVFDGVLEEVARQAFVPMLGNWLTVWSLVPDDLFDKAYENVFDDIYAGEDHSALTDRIQAYNRLVRQGKTENLQRLNETANVYVIARYGYSSAPISDTFGTIGDGVIDAKYASFGATTSLYGEAMEDKYLENIPPKFISPNKSIDASTCLFPDQTWFVFGMRHFKSPEPLNEFITTLLRCDEQATVNTFEEYPRFLSYNANMDLITEDVDISSMGLMKRIITVIKEIFRLIKRWFTKK